MAFRTIPLVANAATSVPTDLIGSADFPRSKLTFGIEGVAADVSAVNPLPVEVQALATSTRAYTFASGQRPASVTAQTRSTAITATEVLLHASARCFYRVGDVSVVATVGAGSIPLEAGEKFHQRITSGQFISVIRDTADGFLTIMPVA